MSDYPDPPNSGGAAPSVPRSTAAGQRSLLIIHAHPAPHVSRANRALAEAAAALPCATVHEIYANYPGMFIDVRREQELLLAHDTIVLQHPLYWYSMPALLKEWVDLVLEHGWAYGPGGERLLGKRWSHAISTGGAGESYSDTGSNRYPIGDYLRPLEQTARLCGMRWCEPFISHAPRVLGDAELDIEAGRYCRWLEQLRSEP